MAFDEERVKLPVNPITKKPTILVPKRWLRMAPWIGCEDYITSYYEKIVHKDSTKPPERVAVLNFNRYNYDVVQAYVKVKERTQVDCRNDPLFHQLPVSSVMRKLTELKMLPSGTAGKADKRFEELQAQLLSAMLYPQLDFASAQSRTDSGVLIRDLIFYNNRDFDFLADIHHDYGSRQIVMEMKNVKAIEREHINQLNRYLSDIFGRFGVIVTRNPLPSAMFQNTIDLWAGQRRCIIAMTDHDVELMATVFESKQRLPIEVLKAKYIEFTRRCPS